MPDIVISIKIPDRMTARGRQNILQMESDGLPLPETRIDGESDAKFVRRVLQTLARSAVRDFIISYEKTKVEVPEFDVEDQK